MNQRIDRNSAFQKHEFKKPKVWIETGLILTYGSNLDANIHSHMAIQVVWPGEDSVCILNGQRLQELIIIGSQVSHCLELTHGWILLVEPNSVLGESLTRKLDEKPHKSIPSLCSKFDINNSSESAKAFESLTPMFEALDINSNLIRTNANTVSDPRISQLLTELNLCFQGECIIPDNWRAKDASEKCNLSESRFLHLFTEQIGIAWRPYLLWRRMLCALQYLVNGQSATKAAYAAGFSDSAHLSRTFKSMFGMTIKQAKELTR